MESQSTCLRCKSPDLEKGDLRSQYGVVFKLFNAPRFSLTSTDVKVTGQICLNCGFIELTGDTEQAERAAGK